MGTLGSGTKITVTLGTVIAVAVAAFGFHSYIRDWRQMEADAHIEMANKLVTIESAQKSNRDDFMKAIRNCWSVEDQQNWKDECERIQPGMRWPNPNETIRKRNRNDPQTAQFP